jgi:opacity protein-like surface antigen
MTRPPLTAAAAALALASSAHAADLNTLSPDEQAAGWQLLFDGRTLDGWQASDAPGSFSVKDGAIVVRGPRSHLFYMGPVQQHEFRNFEFKADVLTFPKANSGIYFHTQWQAVGWPSLGYEVQVNNSHSDPSRTGGLWGVQDFRKVVSPDGSWFTLTIRVEGKHVTTFVGSEKTADYTEESPIVRKKGLEQRYLARGTFALQGHDPESEVHFRNIKVRVLP